MSSYKDLILGTPPAPISLADHAAATRPSQPAELQASQPASLQASQLASQPAGLQAIQPAAEPASQPSSQHVGKPARQQASARADVLRLPVRAPDRKALSTYIDVALRARLMKAQQKLGPGSIIALVERGLDLALEEQGF